MDWASTREARCRMSGKAKLILGAVDHNRRNPLCDIPRHSSSWQYYLLVDECRAQSDDLRGKRLRVSGRVAGGSLNITTNRRKAAFLLDGKTHQIRVSSSGPLPDNLTEGMEVVVEGKLLADGHLQADRVITRCASKYAAGANDDGRRENQPRPAILRSWDFALPDGQPSQKDHG